MKEGMRPWLADWLGGRRQLWIAGLWTLAVALSALQIYLREVGRGAAAPWGEVALANLLAWLPWLLAPAPAMWLERRLPIAGQAAWRHAAVHLALAASFSVVFLLYLSVFHLVYLDGLPLPLSLAALRAEYAEQLGRFFMTAAALYAAIVFAGRAERNLLEQRRAERRRHAGETVRRTAPTPLMVRSLGRLQRIDPTEVRWVAAEGNYVRLHLETRSVLHRRGLAALVAELADQGFVRIHRSTIVNLRHARALERRSHGDAVLVLDDGSRLKVSRTFRKVMERNGF